MKLILLISLGLLLAACSREPDILVGIAQDVESGKQNLYLDNYVGGDWDKVCFFGQMDSAPASLTYGMYEDYARQNGIEPTLTKRGYGYILAFISKTNGKVFEVYGNSKCRKVGTRNYCFSARGYNRLEKNNNCILRTDASLNLRTGTSRISNSKWATITIGQSAGEYLDF